MNIYTFWIDLDVISSNLQEFGLVSRGSESIVQKYGSKPKGAWPVKIRFSLGITETDRNLSKEDRDLPKSTLADAMEPEISKSVRIVSGKYRKSRFFWWSDIEDISKMEAPLAIRTVNAAQNRSQRVKRPRNRGLQGVLAKPTRLSRARAEKL